MSAAKKTKATAPKSPENVQVPVKNEILQSKLECESVIKGYWWELVKFKAIEKGCEENKSFSTEAAHFNMEIEISNEALFNKFKVGSSYTISVQE